ncbi:hypothetical protein ACFQBQ_12180 [Granulicella cerasi]|uniref:Uncharacterized protein n=1 Tax=Granulicella cerasi TaxID=741063 RepID=A0ABW1ZDR1_9BACT
MSWRNAVACAAILASVAALPAQTTVTVTPRVLHRGVKRFGINLSGQTFYDSGQMARNLIQRNPGFEGETGKPSCVASTSAAPVARTRTNTPSGPMASSTARGRRC